jgi:hypothetical protein
MAFGVPANAAAAVATARSTPVETTQDVKPEAPVRLRAP